MASEQQQKISVIKPLGPAAEQVKTILFKPFDLRKWFALGFCAWLAKLSQGGVNFSFPPNLSGRPMPSADEFKDIFHSHLPLIIGVATALFVIGLVVMVIFLWLSSRGRFMFLDCIAVNEGRVKMPWHKFKSQANSLFFFRLLMGLALFICLILLLGVVGLMVKLFRSESPNMIILIGVIVFILLVILICAAATVGIVLQFTKDFIMPIMYLRAKTCIESWREFLAIASPKKGALILYIYFQIAITIALSAIVFGVVLLTCCCASCFLAIPYIGTVLFLPVLVFKRAYSLYFLAQFGPDYDVFARQL